MVKVTKTKVAQEREYKNKTPQKLQDLQPTEGTSTQLRDWHHLRSSPTSGAKTLVTPYLPPSLIPSIPLHLPSLTK